MYKIQHFDILLFIIYINRKDKYHYLYRTGQSGKGEYASCQREFDKTK